MKLTTLIDELQTKSDELAKVFSEAGPEMDFENVKSIEGADAQTTEQKVAWVRERDAEIIELTAKVKEAADLEKAREGNGQLATVLGLLDQPANMLPTPAAPVVGGEPKSFGESFFKGFDSEQKGKEFSLDGFEVKTLFETAAGWLPESTRTGRLVDYAVAPISILDFIPSGTTNQAAIVYMEETTYTQSAAEALEGGTYAESAFELTEQTSTVRKVAHFIPVTDEQLEDVSQTSSYLDRNMRKGLTERMALQVLVGDGTAPNLSGILDRAIQTQAKGTDPVPDAIHKALTKVRVGGYGMPNLIVMNPNDWQDVRLLRTTDGIYIWGSPSEAGPATIWGLPVAQESRLTENTGLVGDFDYCDLAYKRGVEVKVSDSHSDYFIKGKQAVRADVRVAFQVYRPYAFCTVTSI